MIKWGERGQNKLIYFLPLYQYQKYFLILKNETKLVWFERERRKMKERERKRICRLNSDVESNFRKKSHIPFTVHYLLSFPLLPLSLSSFSFSLFPSVIPSSWYISISIPPQLLVSGKSEKEIDTVEIEIELLRNREKKIEREKGRKKMEREREICWLGMGKRK